MNFTTEELANMDAIIAKYSEVKPAPRNKLLDYFIAKKLKNLMDVIEEF